MTHKLFERIQEELDATKKECAVRWCSNKATHTCGGRPTCDDCMAPMRKKAKGIEI